MEVHTMEERVPLPANHTSEDVIDLLSLIYMKTGIQEVRIGETAVVVRRRAVEGDTLLEPDILEPQNVFNRADMEEVESVDPHRTIFNMFFRINAAGYEVSHVFVNNFRALRKWLGLPEMVSLGGRLFGARVQQDVNVPDDVLLVCGSALRSANVSGIQYIVKACMLEEDEIERLGRPDPEPKEESDRSGGQRDREGSRGA